MAKIDLLNPEDFRKAGFKDCSRCGWSFDSETFDTHNCDEMSKPAHNHIGGDCGSDCPRLSVN